MKTIIKTLIASAALSAVLSPTLLQAQPDMPPLPPPPGEECGPGPQEHFLAMLVEKLSLTAEQQTKVAAIFTAEKAALDALRDNTQNSDMETIHAKVENILSSNRAKIRALLTTAQQKTFDALKPARRGPPPPPPGEGCPAE